MPSATGEMNKLLTSTDISSCDFIYFARSKPLISDYAEHNTNAGK